MKHYRCIAIAVSVFITLSASVCLCAELITTKYPSPGATTESGQVKVGASLPALAPSIDSGSIKLFLDGADVTSYSKRSSSFILFTPQGALTPGRHDVKLAFTRECGKYGDSGSCAGVSECKWNAESNTCASSSVEAEEWFFTVPGAAAPDEYTAADYQQYPMPYSTIREPRPNITYRLPTDLSPPLNPATIKMTLDGNDVTNQSIITANFISYTPPQDLSQGTHYVQVVYQQTCAQFSSQASCGAILTCTWNTELNECQYIVQNPPVTWQFTISVAPLEPAVPEALPTPGKEEISGSYQMTVANINLDEQYRAANYPYNKYYYDIKYVEGIDKTGKFDFTYKYRGQSLVGHYDRSVEQRYGRANDRFYFIFTDDDRNNVTLGDFSISPYTFSEYTISGVKIRGLMTEYKDRNISYTTFYGRSQESQGGYNKRTSGGIKVDIEKSNTNTFKITGVGSNESSFPGSRRAVNRDYIYGIEHKHKVNNLFTLDSQAVYTRHSESGTYAIQNSGQDTMMKSTLTYYDVPFKVAFGWKKIGPKFSPTTYSSFTEKDQEGVSTSFEYKPASKKVAFSSSYDLYNNNLHNQKRDDVTDETSLSKTSVTLAYGKWLPEVYLFYSNQYKNSNVPFWAISSTADHDENATLKVTKKFHNTDTFQNTTIVYSDSRYDLDRNNIAFYGSTTNPDFYSHSFYWMNSNTSGWNFSVGVLSRATISLSTSTNEAESRYRASTDASFSESWSRSITSSANMKFYVIPSKVTANYNYRRYALRMDKDDGTHGGVPYTSSMPLEYDHELSLDFILNRKEKLSLTYITYDKTFRAPDYAGRSFDENVVQASYSTSF